MRLFKQLPVTKLELAFIAGVICCALGVLSPIGAAFIVPLLLIPALALARARRVFLPLALISAIGLGCKIILHAEISAFFVEAPCVLVLMAFYFLEAEAKTESTEANSEPPETNVEPAEANVELQLVPDGETDIDLSEPDIDLSEALGLLADNAENSVSGATRDLPNPVVDRLASSGQFSLEQLDVLRAELADYPLKLSDEDSCQSFIDMPMGTRVANYEIDSTIGKGGSGQVYTAHPIGGGGTIAIKLLRNVHTTDRFQREMEMVQQLAHPNVVVAYEVGNYQDMSFIAMEKLAGPDLHQHVVETGPMDWEQSLDVIVQAARGLDHAHRRGLIHRDVKPANLVWDDGRVKITDLGLAVVVSEEGDQNFQTIHNSVAGTPDFMAPEQARGLGNATTTADVYSLGATWYFLLTGKSRVKGDSLRSKLSCVFAGNEFNELPPDVLPPSVLPIWEKMIAYESDQRYQSMASVIEAIEQLDLIKSLTTKKNNVEVLVVEDNEDDLYLTVELVRRSNKAVGIVTAHTMREAIDICGKFSAIDLVLLDLRLPDSAGIETVERMKSVVPDVPIVVLTGQNDVELGQACIAAGAEEFACKNDLNAHLMERMIFITLSRFQHRNPLHTITSRAPDVS